MIETFIHVSENDDNDGRPLKKYESWLLAPCDHLCSTSLKSVVTCRAGTEFWSQKLKANRQHQRDYRQKVRGLVMLPLCLKLGVIAFCCTWQAEPIILTATLQSFDLALLTLTSKQGKWWQWSQNTFKVKGQMVQTGELGQTYKQMDATKCIISLLSGRILQEICCRNTSDASMHVSSQSGHPIHTS